MAKRKHLVSMKQADDLFAKVEAQPAQMTLEQFKEISEALTQDGEWIRLTLLTLTRTGKQLYETTDSHDGALQFARLLEAVKDVSGHLKSLSVLIESAEARLMVAVAHHGEPVVDILKQAKAEAAAYREATS